MKLVVSAIAFVLALSMYAIPASAQNLVVNGGFEQPQLPNDGRSIFQGEVFGGWTVESGSINLMGRYPIYGTWMAADGGQSVDLNGDAEGSIYQDVVTSPGNSYILRFAMSGNYSLGDAIKTMQVYWGGEVIGSEAFDTTGCDAAHMQYVYYEYTVTAQSSLTRLQFTSTNGGPCGPVLDDISLVAVPEPSSLLGLMAALGASGTLVWRRRL